LVEQLYKGEIMGFDSVGCKNPFGETRTTSKRKQEDLSWTLAWCHEDCFKESSQELRHALFHYAKEMGGEFRRFKKTRHFIDWLPRKTKPYILVTDWRMAKPCVVATIRDRYEDKAASTVVHCVSTKQAKRAQEWASILMKPGGNSGGNVNSIDVTLAHILSPVLQTLRHPDYRTSYRSGNVPNLSEHLAQLATVEGTCLSQKTQPTIPSIQLDQQTQPKDGTTLVRDHCQETQLRKIPVQTGTSMHALNATHATDAIKAVSWVAPKMAAHAAAMDPRMAEFWTLLRCPKQVERVLIAAVPEYYED